MRRQISKHLVRRSEAIRTALNNYNALARVQNPPRPKLDYGDVMAYGWLGEFELLKHSSHALLEKPWSSPAARDVMVKYFKIQCAQAEIQRLNVEIPRLQQWVDDEDAHLPRIAADLEATDPLLAEEIRVVHRRQRRINRVHRSWLSSIYALGGYSGPRPTTPGAPTDIPVVQEDAILPDEDDNMNDEAVRMEETIRRLVL